MAVHLTPRPKKYKRMAEKRLKKGLQQFTESDRFAFAYLGVHFEAMPEWHAALLHCKTLQKPPEKSA